VKLLVLCILVVATSCAVKRPVAATYRVVSHNNDALLIPPGVSDTELDTFTLNIKIPVRPCALLSGGPVRIQSRRKLVVHRNDLLNQTGDWLSQWATLLETAGCVATGDGWRLATLVAESVPLDSRAAFRLLYGEAVDFGPQLRIQIDSPLFRDETKAEFGTSKVSATSTGLAVEVTSSDNLLGYERAWYGVTEKPRGDGANIVALMAESHVNGGTEQSATPRKNYLSFPPDAAYYRLIYKQEQTIYTALVVAGRTRAQLSENAAKLSNGNCSAIEVGYCLPIPKGVAANLFLPVNVNGKEELIHWGGTVSNAIGKQDPQTAAIVPRLSISKLYKGKPTAVAFDRSSLEILNLRLTGGEALSWK
jgi:hypothetical protein